MEEVIKQDKSKSYKEFEKNLSEDLINRKFIEGEITSATIEEIGKKFVFVDLGLKSSGAIPIEEFKMLKEMDKISVGAKVDVLLEKLENRAGEIVVSFAKAKKQKTWVQLEKKFANKDEVTGMILSKVKGGWCISINSCLAFCPNSQLDISPKRNIDLLMKTPQTFQIEKIDNRRKNIVVSRRAIIEKARNKDKNKILSKLNEGDVCSGTIKAIVDWGVFVDLAGIDSLMHITEIAWSRVSNPSSLLSIGQKISVKIIKIERDTLKVHVSLKRLTKDPYTNIINQFEVGKTYPAVVTKVQEYGVFAALAEGLEGLIHSSQLSHTKRTVIPRTILSTSQKINVVLLEKDLEKRRLSLSYKDTFENPWVKFEKNHKVGDIVSGVVKARTDYGLFITIDGTELDSLCHYKDLSFEERESELEKFKKGQKIKQLKILEIKDEKIRLGIKQLEKDDFDFFMNKKISDIVTGTVHSIDQKNGIYIQVGKKKNLKIFIKKNNLAMEVQNQRPSRWVRGDTCDSVITQLDKNTRTVQLSIKQLEKTQTAEAIKRYGSKDSGGVLSDLFDFSKVKTKKTENKK